jgi:hypothetical protein
MKNKLFRNCAYISAILFLAFVGLYTYILVFNPNPSSDDDWRSVSIGHGTISTAHSRQISTDTNRPGMLIYPEDGGGNFHFTVAQGNRDQFSGCYLIFLNQNMPEDGFMRFATPGDSMTNNTYFHGYGIDFGSGTHTASLFGFSKNDRESEMRFIGYGIYFSDTSHTVDKTHNWWTLMISLWYPIILFGILPAIFVINKLRGRKPASTKNTPIEK